ncbi:MAG: oligosaccharide flippase family protein, partial [Bacteroidetes bacterium]|nr:oligosaccharide flippase family protein [Bacteroidota bacterium]
MRSLGIYSLSNVLNSAIPFLLLPILTAYLAPSDYGVLSNYNSLISLLIPFVSLNLMASLQVIYVKKHEELASYISSGILTMLVLTLAFSLLLFLFAEKLEDLIGVPTHFIYFTAIYATYQNLIEVLLSIWRMEDKAMKYGLFRVVRTAVELSLAIIFVVGLGWSFEGSIYALIYSYGFGALVTIFILFKRGLLIAHIQKQHIRHLITYGAPLIPHVLGGVIVVYSDKLVLTAYHGLAANGIYSVGFMVGQVIGLFQNSFNQAWVPWVFQKLKTNTQQDRESIVYWTYLYFVGIVLLTVAFYFCTPLIFQFLGKSYASGLELVFWIALGFAFNGMYKMVSVYFFYHEK